ncbi:hypothetical protein [Streptomyces sp. NBC_01304]|nr:hypothetical protein OG430_00050 [Streptomyces sp. NBC_01304]WSJ90887.1 hypothetical protein OG430_47460 [Streptomyces sp. NBC_01304]
MSAGQTTGEPVTPAPVSASYVEHAESDEQVLGDSTDAGTFYDPDRP